MPAPVTNKSILDVAYDYATTVNGAKDLCFKPIKTALDIAHYNGSRTRISENVRNLAEDAGGALDFAEFYPKLCDAISKVFTFFKDPGFFNFGELSAKIARFAACAFKCLEFLAKKGVAMLDSVFLKTWASRCSTLQFGWGTIKEIDNLSSNVPQTDRDVQEKTLSAIKLVFNASLLTLSAASAALSPFALLVCSCTALVSSIGGEFYGKLNGLK